MIMAISNLNNVHLTDEQLVKINNALIALEEALNPLQINLTPEERKRYGRVNEQNKLFVNKVKDFADSEPNLSASEVDWNEFNKDFKSRIELEKIINRLKTLETQATNAKILHDYDNYQDALADYAYTSYRAGSNAVGFERKYSELKQFFLRSHAKNTPKPDNL